MSVYRVLEKLEAYVHEGTWLPVGYRILSEERLLEYIEKIRSTLPTEVGRAKIIAKDQDRVMRAAQEKAQAIVDEAASKHEELVDQNEIVLRARKTAEIVRSLRCRRPRRNGSAAGRRARSRTEGPFRSGPPSGRCRGQARSRHSRARRGGREEQAGGLRSRVAGRRSGTSTRKGLDDGELG